MNHQFESVEQAFRSEGAGAVFDFLIRRSREARDHQSLFGALDMRIRHRLGLPLIETGPVSDVSAAARPEYEQALLDAARECGGLCLEAGDIPSAWAYFKAVGDSAPVAAAIDTVSGGPNLDRIIQIACQEGVNPRKGFELILEHRGLCNAITWFGAIRDSGARQHSLRLLVRTLHRDVVSSLKETIAAAEGAAPETPSLKELMGGRPWLFEGASSYVDATHLASVLRFTPELQDQETLRLALELAEYGEHLNPMFHFRGDPPFEDVYRDHAVFLRALVGQDVEEAIAHFRAKAAAGGESGGAEILIDLLVRLGRMQEAIGVSLECFPDANAGQLACPSTVQLCQMAGDYARLREVARERGDLLGFAAGLIQS